MNSTDAPALTETALRILAQRYLLKNENGEVIETPEGMFRRVARHVAGAEAALGRPPAPEREEEFYNVMANLEFLPNSPTLMNAGTELGQLSACFVLPIDDSIESIFRAVSQAARIHQSGGGCGYDFSKLRPKEDRVHSTQGTASGPVSFIEVFDAGTQAIKQGGRRRGANMAVLRVDHPDIREFVQAKSADGRFSNFNFSVALTEEFLEALEKKGDFPLVNPRTGKAVRTEHAQEVFDLIAQSAWKTGEPGVLFLPAIHTANPLPHLGAIAATNPCGEVPLLPYESCNLGSINLARMATGQVGDATLDDDRIERVTRTAVRFLDNVIDVNRYPLPEVREATLRTRKIGLGVMGFADLLIRLGVAYDEPKARQIADEVMGRIARVARKTSEELARQWGAYPEYGKIPLHERKHAPRRNATLTSIAPTGTISLIADCSSGIEPIYARFLRRRMPDGSEMVVPHPLLAGMLSATTEEAVIPRRMPQMSAVDSSGNWEDIGAVFRSAHEIHPVRHVEMQAIFQRHTDNAVSKTVNLPMHATVAEVKDLLLEACARGCKGITVYRDGSRVGQVLQSAPSTPKAPVATVRARPQKTIGTTTKFRVGCGNLFVTANGDERGLCEVFTTPGRTGGCPSQSEATSRLVSIALRAGVPIADIVHQLKGVACRSCIKKEGVEVLSCADAIGQALEQAVKDERPSDCAKEAPKLLSALQSGVRKCPECGSEMQPEARCALCLACGFRECA